MGHKDLRSLTKYQVILAREQFRKNPPPHIKVMLSDSDVIVFRLLYCASLSHMVCYRVVKNDNRDATLATHWQSNIQVGYSKEIFNMPMCFTFFFPFSWEITFALHIL